MQDRYTLALFLIASAFLMMFNAVTVCADLGYANDCVVTKLKFGVGIDEVNERHGTSTYEQITGTKVYLLGVPPGMTAEEAVVSLGSDGDFLSVELNPIVGSMESGQSPYWEHSGYDSTFYHEQWATDKIGVYEAHQKATGMGVTVAVLGTGVEPNHTALTDRLMTGYDFVDDDDAPWEIADGMDSDNDGTVDEDIGQGTHLAGIITLIAPDASIMPLRVLNPDGKGDVFRVSRAIRYAVDNGANVIICAFGTLHTSETLKKEVEYAYSHGCVLVAPVGDWDIQDMVLPAAYDHVIAVAAVDSQDIKVASSSFGNYVTVSAPGERICSTFWDGGYAWWNGASMAASIVAAEAALLREFDPDAEVDGLIDCLEGSAANIDGLNPNYQGLLGSGRINVSRGLGCSQVE
jgi:subtilisin family serine protease